MKPSLAPHVSAALRKPAKAKPLHPADQHTLEQVRRCVRFNACIFRGHRGPGKQPFDSEGFDTLAEAREALAGNPRGVVYGVTPEGYTIHVPKSYNEGD